jgi:O-antigen/teichoic acid export membrane protein
MRRTEVVDVLELVGGAGITALLNFIYVIYVGRALRPEEYGDFAAALSVIFVVTLALSPIGPSLARRVAARVVREREPLIAPLRQTAIRWLVPRLFAIGILRSP